MVALQGFVLHLNSQFSFIKFTVEIEKEGILPFLDIKLIWKTDRTLERKVYHNPTHTNLYLPSDSFHHPAQKLSALATLVDRDHLQEELDLLKNIFRKHGFDIRYKR